MIGETKLWKFNKSINDWEIFKIFKPSANVFERLTWLDILQQDEPKNIYVLSQHNPTHSVGD